MMRRIVLAWVAAAFCTAIAATPAFAQTIEVVGLDARPISVIRQVIKLEVRQLQ